MDARDLRSRSCEGCGGVHCSLFPAMPMSASLANCDMEALVQPSPEQVEAYELYLHLPELTRLWRTKLYPMWKNEIIVRPALHSLELVFRMISVVLCDTRPYIDRDEWLRRLESLANLQLEILSCIVEGDDKAPTSKLSSSSSYVGAESVVWHKSGSRPVVSRVSKESLLPRLASWRTAQNVSTRMHFAIEGHLIRAPFTLGLGELNLSGKPVLEYDKICTPLEVYACRQSMPGHPEDHTLSTVHQIMEAWLEVASGLLRNVEMMVKKGNFESAAKSCRIVERVWKLLISTMDLLQIMDPDDFMRLKEELAISQDGKAISTEHIGGGAYCLRSSRLRQVTKDCKELRHLVPKVVGVEADPKGGPRLQEAVMDLLHSHGMCAHIVPPFKRPMAYHSSTIHLLQAFQAVEAAIRQFYFSYQQLVIAVMGSGEYKATAQTEISAADALAQIYFEPPYFPSLDGAKTFLGSYWHNNPELEEGAIMRQLMVEKAMRTGSFSKASSVANSDSGDNIKNGADEERTQRNMSESIEKQYVNAALAYKNHHVYQGAMGA
ncbi:nematode resistance protein-like HSPRO2 isoform X2 [Physcomitrium patens]|nr:nematode resistance protein-like HSPRO2 isoform X2 [Physcomitrium patens]|eukprot:XP_024380430.1 nematode resistance protein-like HSPRO2 isoform X2 [Physcomitrella patens]